MAGKNNYYLGANVTAEDNLHQTPLHNAAFNGRYDMINFLLDNGASVNSKNRITSPLHHACFSGHEKCVQLLIEKG